MSQANPTKTEVNKYSESFVLYGDQSKAWRTAYPNSKAVPRVVNINASKLHKHPDIQLRVNELQVIMSNKANDDFDINSDWLLGELKGIRDLDVLDIFTDDLKAFKPLSEWPKAWRINISGIDLMEISNGDESVDMIVKKIKWPDKAKNLEMIGRHVKVKAWDKEQQVINNNNIMPVPTADSVDDWEAQAQAHQEKVLKKDV